MNIQISPCNSGSGSDSLLPYGSNSHGNTFIGTSTMNVFHRCGIHSSKKLFIAPETISFMGIDPLSDGK